MERPTKKLWRKIGLQKNFLQGTFHSDQSKNAINPSQQSLVKELFHMSNFREETENVIIQPNTVYQQGEIKKDQSEVEKQENLNKQSYVNPVTQLSIISCEEREITTQNVDDTIELINDNKQSGINFNQSIKESLICFQSIKLKEQQDETYKKIISQTVPYIVQKDKQETKDSRESDTDVINLKQEQKKRKQSGDSMKIRLYGIDQKESLTNESQQAKKILKNNHQDQDLIEKVYTLEIDPKQLEKYHKIQSKIKKIKTVEIPKLHDIAILIQKHFGLQKSFIEQEIHLMRQSMTEIMTIQLSESIQQMNDQIGYLYSENQELITKLESKQSIIKKHLSEYQKIKQQHQQFALSIQTSYQEKDLKIIQLQNQINKLEQKLEDFEQLETKIEKQKQKNQQLESQISILIQNEKKFIELMDQKTFDLSAAIIKNQELQWEVNELHSKNQQLQFNLTKQHAQKIEKLSSEHFHKLSQQKFLLDQQKQKNKINQSMIETLYGILSESLKHLNFQRISAIQKQFSIQENEQLNKIFQKAIFQAQSFSRTNSFHKDSQPIDSIQLSPGNESENGNSSNKNLRRTGYFGQVTKASLSIRLDDIQKNISKEIIDDEKIYYHHNSKRQNQTLYREDAFSSVSQQVPDKQSYAFRSVQPSYSRSNQNQENSNIKNSENFIHHQNYQNNRHNHSIQLTGTENVNYSFSRTNWNSFDGNNDRSNIITYEKSSTNYRDEDRQMLTNTYKYQRASTQRSEKSDRSSSNREDIIEKIKERVKQKLKSKEKYNVGSTEPTYNFYVEPSKRLSYHQRESKDVKLIKKDDLILADFFQKHSMKNPVIAQHQTERRTVPLPNRSPSATKSRSPSNSSSSRAPSNTIRLGMTKYTPVGTATYATVNQNKTTISVTPKSTFSRSMVQKPQMPAYSMKSTNQLTSFQTYQPKSGLYTLNKGETQFGSSYGKKI